MSKFTINILDPSSPVEPDIPVPDTGFYTNTSNTNGSISILAPAIVLVVVLMLLTPVFIKLIKRHSKKNNGYTNINTNTDSISINNRANLKRALLIITPVTTLALIIPAIVFAISNNTSDEDNVKTNNIETTELTELEKLASERDLSITVSANDVNLDVTLDSDSSNSNNGAKTGVYAVGESTIIINTPTVSGYKLYASAEDADLYLNGDKHDTDHKISAVSNGIEYDEFLSPNTWGISGNPSVVDDPTLQSWFVFPSEPVEIEGSSSATEADHEVGTLYFGTYITPNLVNKDTKEGYGTYSGVTINYIAIANPIAYNIEYNKNTTDDVTDMPSNESGSTYDETITLSSNVPKRTKHTFIGWCDGIVTTDTATHTDTCDGTIYNPNGSGTDLTYTIDQTISPNNLTLYAMWQEIPYTYSVTYHENTEEEVTNMPDNIPETTTYDNTITLSSAIPARTNSETKYKFIGWCTAPVLDSESCDSPNTKYSPGASYTLDSSTTNEIKLYAMWDMPLWSAVVNEWEEGGYRVQTKDDDPDTGIEAQITIENSGVFQYNSDAFGEDTDATKPDGTKYDIYYYRGILDSDLDDTKDTYGSNGDGKLWPNYVRLDDTCWRIVRTTGSSGVKMIYNGSYSGGTTANSCANALDDAQLTTVPFNAEDNISYKSIIAVGYTFNSDYKTERHYTPYGELFGTNDDYSGNTTDSTIKDYIENTWFTSESGISAYESMLEPNAGYCNDRSIYEDLGGIPGKLIEDDGTIYSPYAPISTPVFVDSYYFGAMLRNFLFESNLPSFACPRNKADVYTTKTTEGNTINTHNGNGQLKYPVALLTADEASFAGSGDVAIFHVNSYLRSGSDFWLLSPGSRDSDGNVNELDLLQEGFLDEYTAVNATYGIRPTISLSHETIIASGDGTAVDPWVIQPDNSSMLEATDPLGVMEENDSSWQTLKIVLLVLSIVSMTFYILVLIQKIKNHNKEVE